MSEILDLPAVTMDGTTAGCNANRTSYDPFAEWGRGGILPCGYEPLAGDSFVISQVLRSWQPLGATAAGLEGRVTLFIDRGGLYDKEVGFSSTVGTTYEDGHPRGTQPLAYLDFYPGSRPPFIRVEAPLTGPITFHKGDRLGVAPETNGVYVGAGALQGFFGVGIDDWAGVKFATNVVHAMPLNTSAPAGSGPPASFRGVIPVPKGGTRAKVHFSALGDGFTLAHSSAGIRTGSQANMVATPVALAFGGAAGFTLPAKGDIWSDDIVITSADGDCLVVDINLPSTAAWAFKMQAGALSGVNTWYSTTAAYNTASQSSPMLQAGRLHGIDCVKVWTP